MDPILKVGGAVVLAAVVAVAASSVGRRYGPVPPPYPTPAYSRDLDARLAAATQPPAATAAPKGAVEAGGVRLVSVAVALPTEGRPLSPGAGADAVAANCTACHTAGMILTQPPLTRAEWTGEVNKMIAAYKAPVDKAAIPAIVDYLAALQPGR